MEGDAAASLMARSAAVREASAEYTALEARLSVARSLLDATNKRADGRDESTLALQNQEAELQAMVDEKRRTMDLLHESVAACELRLGLSRQCLCESGPKLEALRTRGAMAEERHRAMTIRLGKLNERLREREQQLYEFQRHALEQRVRVGLAQWQPPQRCDDALRQWRAIMTDRRRQQERLQHADIVWRTSAVHHAMAAWQLRHDHARAAAAPDVTATMALSHRERALVLLDQASDGPIGGGRP